MKIGDGNIIAEICDINTGSVKYVGCNRMEIQQRIMALCTIAHVAQIEVNTILANSCSNLADSVHINELAIIEGCMLVQRLISS